MSYHRDRNRLKDRPKSAQQENIDKQILCLHKLIQVGRVI